MQGVVRGVTEDLTTIQIKEKSQNEVCMDG